MRHNLQTVRDYETQLSYHRFLKNGRTWSCRQRSWPHIPCNTSGDGLIKLRDFVELVKDAPRELATLIEEIEVFKAILADVQLLDTHSLPGASVVSNTTSFKLCCDSLAELDLLLQSLVTDIRKGRKGGSFRTVLKKSKIGKLRERIRDAQFLLIITRQSYFQ